MFINTELILACISQQLIYSSLKGKQRKCLAVFLTHGKFRNCTGIIPLKAETENYEWGSLQITTASLGKCDSLC